MKKKLFLSASAVLLFVAVSIFIHVNTNGKIDTMIMTNVEALTNNESASGEGGKTVVQYMCETVGCCGGERKCVTPSINLGGFLTAGITFYMD